MVAEDKGDGLQCLLSEVGTSQRLDKSCSITPASSGRSEALSGHAVAVCANRPLSNRQPWQT